jgi:RimJ/RimL family protein N-acetyltransferase
MLMAAEPSAMPASGPAAPDRLPFPDPLLTDGVVTLRRLVPADEDAIVKACSDPETQRWLDFLPNPYLPEHARAFIASAGADWTSGHAAVFAIADAHTGGLLGALDIEEADDRHPYLGCWVGPWARGRGVATRAIVLASRWAVRELRLSRLEILVDPGNAASLKITERSGFVREGRLRNFQVGRDGPADCLVYSLIPSDIATER